MRGNRFKYYSIEMIFTVLQKTERMLKTYKGYYTAQELQYMEQRISDLWYEIDLRTRAISLDDVLYHIHSLQKFTIHG